MKAISNTLFTSDSGEPRGIIDRSEFMIDGFRVGYETGAGCRCVCVEFATRASCKHTREAAGRLAAQSRIAEHLSQGASKAYSIRALVIGVDRRPKSIAAHSIALVRARI